MSESDGTVQLVLVKDGDTVRDYQLEIRLLPLTAGELYCTCTCVCVYSDYIVLIIAILTSFHILCRYHHTELISLAGTSDFDASTQSITFRADEGRQKTTTITITNDSILENAESFSVQLTISSGTEQSGVVANSSVTITILDDDSEYAPAN